MKVGISYGWSEGPWQSKKLRFALQEAGFHITKHLGEADVLIAHSGGCYTLPDYAKAKVIILVGLPYYPGKHPLRSLKEKVRHELKDMWWVKKTIFNTYYMLTRPRKWFRMWRAWKNEALPAFEEIPIVAIRNQDDHFLHPIDGKTLAESKGWSLETLAGHHDDIWINPQAYVKIIQNVLK